MQDQSKGEVTMERPDGQSARMRGLFLDEKTWDGSDIFMLGVAGSICMTEPVHDAIMALKPTNIRFTRLEEVVWLYINRNQPAN